MISAAEELSHRSKVSQLVLFAVFAITVFSSGCNSATPPSNIANQSSSRTIDTKSVVIPVDGLICVVCAARIKHTLEGIHGVTDVTVDLEHRSVRVQYSEAKTSVDGLVTAINGLGYKAGKPSPADSAKSSG